jgi:hypothetical protein
MSVLKWIKVIDGKNLGPVYFSNENGVLDFENQIFDKDTPDEILIKHNLYKLKECLPPENVRYFISKPPIYRILQDGSLTVVEEVEYQIFNIEDIKHEKIQQLYYDKDRLLKDGICFKNKIFDLRFRNLAHLSIISTLISFKKFPNNFKWFTVDGELIDMTENEMLELIELAAEKIIDIETRAAKVLDQINAITDLEELNKFEPRIT